MRSDRIIRVLLVANESEFRGPLGTSLQAATNPCLAISHAGTLRAGQRLLRSESFDVVLLDLSLRDEQGLAAYHQLRACAPSCPIIVSAGYDNEPLALQTVREGAQDYLVQGQWDGALVARVIRYAIERQAAETERREAVAVLRQALSDLKESHEQVKRTQEQLVQAERLEAVSTFAAGIAHEVKNPLQAILLGIDYLSNTLPQDDPSIGIVLGEMEQAVRRADAIIRGLLEYSTLGQHRIGHEDLSVLIEQSLRLVQTELSNHPIQVIKDLEENLPAVALDAKTMKHVFVNLFLNSIRARAEGGTLRVRTYTRASASWPGGHDSASAPEPPGATLVVAEFEDRPSSEENRADPKSGVRLLHKSGGLGATVLQKIIELHGGLIDVRPRKDGSNHMTITFKAQPKESA